MPTKEAKYNEYYETIKRERKWVDIRPYSHNIISVMLRAIDELEYRNITGDKVIKELELDKCGWGTE